MQKRHILVFTAALLVGSLVGAGLGTLTAQTVLAPSVDDTLYRAILSSDPAQLHEATLQFAEWQKKHPDDKNPKAASLAVLSHAMLAAVDGATQPHVAEARRLALMLFQHDPKQAQNPAILLARSLLLHLPAGVVLQDTTLLKDIEAGSKNQTMLNEVNAAAPFLYMAHALAIADDQGIPVAGRMQLAKISPEAQKIDGAIRELLQKAANASDAPALAHVWYARHLAAQNPQDPELTTLLDRLEQHANTANFSYSVVIDAAMIRLGVAWQTAKSTDALRDAIKTAEASLQKYQAMDASQNVDKTSANPDKTETDTLNPTPHKADILKAMIHAASSVVDPANTKNNTFANSEANTLRASPRLADLLAGVALARLDAAAAEQAARAGWSRLTEDDEIHAHIARARALLAAPAEIKVSAIQDKNKAPTLSDGVATFAGAQIQVDWTRFPVPLRVTMRAQFYPERSIAEALEQSVGKAADAASSKEQSAASKALESLIERALAQQAMLQEQMQEAERHIQKARELTPSDPRVYLQEALLRQKQWDATGLAASLNAALFASGSDPALRLRIARFKAIEKDRRGAWDILRKLDEEKLVSPAIEALKARLHVDENHPELAGPILSAAQSTWPNDPWLYLSRIVYEHSQNKTQEAFLAARDLLQLIPQGRTFVASSDAVALFYTGAARLSLGDDGGKSDFDEAMRLDTALTAFSAELKEIAAAAAQPVASEGGEKAIQDTQDTQEKQKEP